MKVATLIGVFLLLVASAGLAQAAERVDFSVAAADTRSRSWSVQIDNDLLSGTHRDHDYSWGVAVSFADSARSTTQVGLIAMTPRDLGSTQGQEHDRPYASLVFATRAVMEVDEGAGHASYTSLTLGVLGLDVAESLQKHVHRVLGGEQPRGWRHQVSAGGEPTARIVRAEQWLVTPAAPWNWGRPEIKLSLSGSAGYLTEGSAAVSLRWGRLESAWWSHVPELADYITTPLQPSSRSAGQWPDLYFFAGGRLKARAYNAFLQGQFRHSAVRVAADDFARVQGEAWVGLATGWSRLRVTYTLRLASREIESGPAARTLLWAGVGVEGSF